MQNTITELIIKVIANTKQKLNSIILKIKSVDLKKVSKRKLVFNHIAPVLGLMILTFTVAYFGNMDFGVAVKYDGEHLVTVENEGVVEKANEILNNLRAVPSENAAVPLTYEITTVGSDEAVNSAYSVYSEIVNKDSEIVSGIFGFYLDGDFIGAVENSNDVKAALDAELADEKLQYGENAEVDFVNDIKYLNGVYPVNSILTVDELMLAVADKLEVAAVREATTVEAVPFTTVYQEDDTQYDSYSRTVQAGVNGSRTVVTKQKYIGGVLVSEEVESSVVTAAPVEEIIVKGTKQAGEAMGSFIWPVPYTSNITSDFGYRWGKLHKGIDISGGACEGADILAADGGYVTWSGYDDSGYGYYVIVDHNNGYKTLYAHCSALYVSAGSYVYQGQVIAALGNTGNSDGAHLHFEILIGDTPVDPTSYV